jgi:hypothetical protein
MGGAPSNMGGNTTVLELTNCDDDEYNADDMLDMLEGFDDELLFKQPCKDLNRIIRQSDDAPWILSAAFMILTMQSGFAMRKCPVLNTKKKSQETTEPSLTLLFPDALHFGFSRKRILGSKALSQYHG